MSLSLFIGQSKTIGKIGGDTMSKIIHIDEIGALLTDLQARHTEGELRSVYVLVQDTDDGFTIAQAGQVVNIFEVVGALEALKLSLWLQG